MAPWILAALCAAATPCVGRSIGCAGGACAHEDYESTALLQSTYRKPRAAEGWGLDLAAMDSTADPGDNFYRYAIGRWLDETEIPGDQTSVSSFSILDSKVEGQVHGLLKAAPLDSLQGKLYASFMDEDAVEALGDTPILPELELIAGLKSAAEFAAYAGSTHMGFGGSPFGLYIGADPKDPSMNVAHLGQAGLGLPSREYYLDASFAETKAAYEKHIAEVLEKISWPKPAASAKAVLALEELVAKASWPNDRLRDPVATYNKMTPAELKAKVPGFDWDAFMHGAGGVPSDTTLIVSAYAEGGDDGIPGIAKVIHEAHLCALRAWAAFHVVAGCSPFLSKDFVNSHFAFFGKLLSGQKEMRPRWKRAVSAANTFVGDTVGREFVEQFFPKSAQEKMAELTMLLKQAFHERIEKLEWMTAETKVKALAKLQSFTFEIGGPKKYREYEGLSFEVDDLFGNAARATAWAWAWDFKQLGKPVDLDYWDMVPQAINAFFDPTQNRCVFLAAILQAPFFSADADMSVNFGGIGAVIGHEMTHGFDDSGRRYDAQGRLNDWWTDADAEEFMRRARKYGEQFANFTMLLPHGVRINPGLTMGENIADLGGVTIAYDAYQKWLEEHDYSPKAPFLKPNDDGLEGDRRFFASWDQVWRTKYTDSAVQLQVQTNPHSPGQARAIIPVQNSDPWYTAYGISKGKDLYLDLEHRVQIW